VSNDPIAPAMVARPQAAHGDATISLDRAFDVHRKTAKFRRGNRSAARHGEEVTTGHSLRSVPEVWSALTREVIAPQIVQRVICLPTVLIESCRPRNFPVSAWPRADRL